MTRLRIDVPLLSDEEMEDRVQDIIENMHYRDIKSFRFKLDKAIESHDRGLTQQQMNF